MATGDIITTADYAAYLNQAVTGDATRLAAWTAAISVASRWVQQSGTGRQFYAVTSSDRYFDPADWRTLYITDASAVTAVAIDLSDDGTYTALQAADYQLLPIGPRDDVLGDVSYTTIRGINYLWPCHNVRVGSVKVTGVWGWTSVPADVKQATCILVQDLLRDPDAQFGGLSVTDIAVLGSRVPERTRTLLAPYVRFELVGGIA